MTFSATSRRRRAIPWQGYPGDRDWFHSWGQVNGPLYFGLQHLNDPIKLLAVALNDDRFAAYGRSCDLLSHGETRCPERLQSAARDQGIIHAAGLYRESAALRG
jgi:hypothetical protein